MTKSVESVDGIIERIGYDPSGSLKSGGGSGDIYLVLVDDNNIYKHSANASIVYAEVVEPGNDEQWLLLLTQQGDHITFEVKGFYPYSPFLEIKLRSLRNWTLEHRLTDSLKDITPLDKNLLHSKLNLPSNDS